LIESDGLCCQASTNEAGKYGLLRGAPIECEVEFDNAALEVFLLDFVVCAEQKSLPARQGYADPSEEAVRWFILPRVGDPRWTKSIALQGFKSRVPDG
jgi:hypothetical protein